MRRVWKWLTPRSLLLIVVALPMLLASLYYTVLAHDRFVSEAIISVRHANSVGQASSGLAVMLPGITGASHEDARYLRDYLESLGLMRRLDEALQLRRHYASATRDPFLRLWPAATQEDLLAYWRRRVDVRLDELSGTLTLRVEGFDPAFAQAATAAMISDSDLFVNSISQRIGREQMTFVDSELARASTQLDESRAKLAEFQTRHRMLDPLSQTQASGALASELRGELAKAEAELNTKRAYLNDDTAEIVGLKARAAALRQQIDREALAVTQPHAASLNRLALEFQALKTQVGFSEDRYKAALGAVETTRLDASRRMKSLVVIEPPTLSQSAQYPRRIYNLLTVLLVCSLLYAVLRLAVAAVNEHRD